MPRAIILGCNEWFSPMECLFIEDDSMEDDEYDFTDKEFALINEAREKFNQVQKLFVDKINQKLQHEKPGDEGYLPFLISEPFTAG